MDDNDDDNDQAHSPTINVVVAWVNLHGTSWEYDTHSSNRIRLTFDEAGLSYTAVATEEMPLCVTLRVSLQLSGIVDELRVHRTLVAVNDERTNGAVFYHHDRTELVWRATFALSDEDLDDIEMGAKSVKSMIEDGIGIFDTVRKRLADQLLHTQAQADLSMVPAQGRA